ncbi:MAG: glycosyltransferase family 4 protein [Legionellales bacterium]
MILILSVFFVVLSVVLTRVFCRIAQNTRLMDKPNGRSLHVTPTVRGGGLVFIGLPLVVLPFLCYVTKTSFSDLMVLIISIFLLATVSFLDDLYNLSSKSRFFVQSIIALLIVLFMRPEQLNFVLFSLTNQFVIIPLLFFTVIWAINHFNFMDGIDGFCAMQALFLLAAYALLFGFHHGLIYQYFCFMLIFCLLGFLIFNFPPAKLFMGDVGSATLGLIVFSLALIAQQKYQIPILYWFMLNSLFLFDATVTLLRRIINKEKWSAAHKKHAYQRLKQGGVGTRVILLGQLVLNGSFLIFVLLAYRYKVNLLVLLSIQCCFIMVLYYLIERKNPMIFSGN